MHEDATFELAPADAPILCRGTLSQAERSAWRRVLSNYREDDDGIRVVSGRNASFTPIGEARWDTLYEPPDGLLKFMDDFVDHIPSRPDTLCEATTDNWTLELLFGTYSDSGWATRIVRISAEVFEQRGERDGFVEPGIDEPFELCDDRDLEDLRGQVDTYLQELAGQSLEQLRDPPYRWQGERLLLSLEVELDHYLTFLTADSHLVGFPFERSLRRRIPI